MTLGEAQVVYVVVELADAGQVVLVASSLEGAAGYIAAHPYMGFVIVERELNVPVVL